MRVHLETSSRALREQLGFNMPACRSDVCNDWEDDRDASKTTYRRDHVTCGNCKRTHLYRRTKGAL